MQCNIASSLVALRLIGAVFFVLGGRGAFASDHSSPTEQQTLQQAYQHLLTVRRFALGGIGFAGTISDGERAFQTVAASTNALELFRAVLKNGSAEGQMYALCGIHRLAPQSFSSHARSLADAESRIRTMSGCLLSEERSSNIVARIAAGSYDLNIGVAQIRCSAYPEAR